MSLLWKGRPRHSRRQTSLLSFVPSVQTFLLFFLFFSFPLVPPSHKIRAHPYNSSWIFKSSFHRRYPLPRCRSSDKDTSSLARPRFHVANSGALYRDKSRTLTVWAFLAAEGGANKVKRGLKNVTLSVECGPLTVDAPLPSRGRTPTPAALLSRNLFSRDVSSNGIDTFAFIWHVNAD